MGLFDFAKDMGASLFTTDKEAAMNIQRHIEANNPGVNPLSVKFDDGCCTLSGWASSVEAREQTILMAGNVKGVEKVVADRLELRIPKVSVAAQAAAAPVAAAAPAAAAAPTAADVEPAGPSAAEVADAGAAEYYEVKRGDTLGAIAKTFYGKSSAYMKIFEANKGVIDNPDRIYPGQKIRIPKA